jgi:hypothetical protein
MYYSMKLTRAFKQLTSGANLASALVLLSLLAPVASMSAMPCDHDSPAHSVSVDTAAAHEHHAGMDMDALADCCDEAPCANCSMDCGTCAVAPALSTDTVRITFESTTPHYELCPASVASVIPPPPTKPPV